MKEITLFIAALSSGGAEHQICILANLLAKKDYKVKLVTYADHTDHYTLDQTITRIRLAENKSKISKLLSVFRFFSFHKTDVIISFGSRDNMLSLIPTLFRKQIKHIVSERCANLGHLNWYKKINYSILYKKVDFIVSNSYTQMAEIADNYPYLKTKTLTITNYTDLNEFSISTLNEIKDDKLKIGIFCRYATQKNYQRFAEVVKLLKDCSPINFKFYWYGNKGTQNNPNKNYLEFKALVEKYGIKDVLELNNHVKDVSSIIPSFDAMCLPSLAEGFSNSISEYICCGKPVICSNVADNKYLVHENINGMLFDPTNTQNMVDTFLSFFKLSNHKRITMGKNSRKIAEDLFDSEKFIAAYINLIES